MPYNWSENSVIAGNLLYFILFFVYLSRCGDYRNTSTVCVGLDVLSEHDVFH